MALIGRGEPLRLIERDLHEPSLGELRVKVAACGVCRTDLHLIDDELPNVQVPIIPGHEVVGTVDKIGKGVTSFALGDRVGIPWLGKTCRTCFYCQRGFENLCDRPQFTGYTIDGGYAEYTIADARYCFPIPQTYNNIHAAPLLCAGLIGYRCLKAAGEGEHLGLYGFGAAAHICAQVARHQNRNVYAFTRPGDQKANAFAMKMGARWAGSSDETPPHPLDAAIIFAPVGNLLPTALRAVRKGGTVVCGGIHMSDIPTFPYEILWGERVVRSVANLTREDAQEFLMLAPEASIETHVVPFKLADANLALKALRAGDLSGAAVLEL